MLRRESVTRSAMGVGALVAQGPDGSLYVSDDRGGRIFRILNGTGSDLRNWQTDYS